MTATPAEMARDAFNREAGATRDELLDDLRRITEALARGTAAEAATLAALAAGAPADETISPEAAARRWGISRWSIYEKVRTGELRRVPGTGRKVVLFSADVAARMAAGRSGANGR